MSVVTYPVLLILSTVKRSFEALGKIIGKSGDTAKRLLFPVVASFGLSHKIAQFLLGECSQLTLSIDDTLLKKIHSSAMVGTGWFFDTKIGRRITAYRLLVGAITNGKYTVPICMGYLFDKRLLNEGEVCKSKLEFIQEFYSCARRLFPNATITIAVDGLFASVEFLRWAVENNIRVIVRMHSNRKVIYNGNPCKISGIRCIQPRGRQMARTIQVTWHDLPLYLTAERRIDKKGEESIVYLAATYQNKRPIQYVLDYKLRWPLEKVFRTGKQSIGIGECFSIQFETQEMHVAAALLAYALAQYDMKIYRLDTPEQAIAAAKRKKCEKLIQRFDRFDRSFPTAYA